MPQLFDPTTVTSAQVAGLNNVEGQSLTATNSEAAIQTAQNLNPSPNIPAYKTNPTNQVVLGQLPPATDYNAIMAGLNTNVATDQTNVNNTQNKITTDTTQLGQQSADQQALEGKYGVAADQKGLNDLNAQVTALNNEANAEKIRLGDNPGILKGGLSAQVNQVEHERTIKALGISSQIQAMQGNLKLANDQVDRALKLKYDPIKAEIETLTKQLDYNYKNLTEAQKEKADAVKTQNDLKLKTVDAKIATEKAFTTTINQGLSNGMPSKVATQAQQLYGAGNEIGARVLMSNFTGATGSQVDANGNQIPSPKKPGSSSFATSAKSLQAQAIPTKSLSKNGSLNTNYQKKLLDTGMPQAQVDWLWKAVTEGNDLESIRQEITKAGGDPKLLDTFVQTLQN